MPITFEQAKNLRRGEVLLVRFANKTERWRVNGKVKLWKRDPNRIEVPIKHGLYDYGLITNNNLHYFERES